MKKAGLILILLMMVYLLPSQVRAVEVGKVAPDFTLRNVVDKENVSLGDFAGDVVVLYVWKITCAFCDDDSKKFDKVISAYVDKRVKGLVVVEAGDELEMEMVAEIFQPASLMLVDPNYTVASLYALKDYPVVIIIDRKNIVRYEGPFRGPGPLNEVLGRLISGG